MFDASDCLRCRGDFPALARTVDGRPLAFLDGPAGTQVPERVIEAVAGYYRRSNANTHGQFPTSRESDRMIEETREAVAAFLGAPDARTISFGQNMTSLTFTLARALGHDLSSGDEIVITQLDHEANRGPWLDLAQLGVAVRELRLLPDGRLDGEELERLVNGRTRLVAMAWASNALGTVNDLLARARQLTREVGALLYVDAVHFAPHFAIDVAALDPDFLVCSAYKFYGPHVGILYTRPGLLERLEVDRLRSQEPTAPCRIETGTLNHAALAGVKAAVEYIASLGAGEGLRERVLDAMEGIGAYEHSLARRYYDEVRGIAGVTVHGPDFSARRAPTVSITIDGRTAEAAARELGAWGVQVWDGDFFAPRPIEALGLAQGGGVLRAGISLYNTEEEVDRLIAGVASLALVRQGA